MGDAGSMMLGMLLAITTILGIGNNITPPSQRDVAAILGAIAVPILVLLIPFLDVLLAIIRRTRRGVAIGHADKEHLHHHLMDIGHGHRQAVLLMYLWSALVSGGALAVGPGRGPTIPAGVGPAGGRALPGDRPAAPRTPPRRKWLAERTIVGPDAKPGKGSEHRSAAGHPKIQAMGHSV